MDGQLPVCCMLLSDMCMPGTVYTPTSGLGPKLNRKWRELSDTTECSRVTVTYSKIHREFYKAKP